MLIIWHALFFSDCEPLLHQIRTKLHGICLPNCKDNLILSAYADDVIVMISRQVTYGLC